MARATTEYVGNDCRGTYEQVHVLRPAGRDWIGMMQAVRMRANMMQGSCDGRGPFPGKIVEIHMGTSRARTGVIMNKKKDMTGVILELVAALEHSANIPFQRLP